MSTAPVLSIPIPSNEASETISLRRKIIDTGTPVINWVDAKEHMSQLKRETHKETTLLHRFVFRSLDYLSLMKFFRNVTHSGAHGQEMPVLRASGLLLLIGFTGLFIYGITWMSLAFIPAIALVLAIYWDFIAHTSDNSTRQQTLQAAEYDWEYELLDIYVPATTQVPPARLLERARDLKHRVPDLQFFVLSFAKDPLLVVTTGSEWVPLMFQNPVIVGAWNTDTDMDKV